MSTAKFNQWLNPDGTENYKCRAWVNFNGIGTIAIRASGNVSSITDNGVGDFTLNFTAAMPDANYTAVGASNPDNVGSYNVVFSSFTATTTTLRVFYATSAGNTKYDPFAAQIAIFR